MNKLKLINKNIVISAAADGIGWCIAEFCLNEQAISIEKILKEAVMRRGLPNRLIVDNES